MKSPFRIFRKHQKKVMVVMVFAALILFGIGDTLIKMVGNTGGSQGAKIVVETNVGNLTQLQMHNLTQQRRIVHRFVALAYTRSHPPRNRQEEAMMSYFLPQVVQHYGFGGNSEREVLNAWLYRHEARKLGIVVSDKQVEEYIDGITDRKLSTKKFYELAREMQIGAKELSDILRDELQAVTAKNMKFPVVVPSPEKYWEYYQQLNTKQVIEVAALPVKDFTGQAPEPTDAQIAKLFGSHKNDIEQAFDGDFKPGFRQPRRVKLQYLESGFADMEAKARASGPVTESEIVEYYESKKEIDARFHEAEVGLDDDASPLDPGFAPETGDENPKDEPDSDANSKEQPGDPPSEPKSKDSRSDDKPERATPQDNPCCSSGVDDDETKQDAALEKSDAAAKPKTDVEPEPDSSGTSKSAEAESKKDSKAPDDSDDPAEDTKTAPEGPSLGPNIGAGKANHHEPPKIKYKPLDDTLRENIRDSIILDRSRKMMKDQVAKVRDAMSKVAAGFAVSSEVRLTDPDARQLAELERRAEAELNKIAATFDMKFGKTPLVSMYELNELPGLGKAQEPGSFDPARGDSTSIVEQAFSSDALCRAFESETVTDVYLCWKVQDVATHVPTDLKEPGILEQVVTAWKRIESLPLAKQRAEALVQRARADEKGFKEALAGETVTGQSQAQELVVAESKEFSFWREPTVAIPMNQNRQQQIQIDDPGVVTKAGPKFMHAVFDELDVGDIGAVLNNDASVYYVVKVVSRRPADRESFKDAALFARNSPYAELRQFDQQIVFSDNLERFNEKYAIKWHDVPGREQGQMTPDEE